MYIYQSPYDKKTYAINSLLDDDEEYYCLDQDELREDIFPTAEKANENFHLYSWDEKIYWLRDNNYINMTKVSIIYWTEEETEDEV